MKEFGFGAIVVGIGLTFCAACLIGVVWMWTHFMLWNAEYSGRRQVVEQEYAGKAIRARAENERQVRVSQAQAELDAAQKTAEAIRIVGQAAKDYPEYRTQEFIGAFAEALKSEKIDSVIYVPTEANIPITEAGKNR